MGKWADFFLGFKKRYDEQVIRNEKMDEFLSCAKANFDKIGEMSNTVTNLDEKVTKLEKQVTNLHGQMANMNDRLEVIGRGTKIELLETLHKWKKILVERGWKTKEEMKEVKELYELYNKKLNGNGQGT
jgi:predicted nuclease with TOPRIM domain